MDDLGKDPVSRIILKAKDTIMKHRMLPNGSCVYAGVSGGMDSMCMLSVLMALSAELGFSLKVCHFNHLLRDKESDDDEIFVEDFCRENGLEFINDKGNVSEFSETNGRGVEESARIMRYAFLNRVADAADSRIAVAHHMTDQFETVLFNLLRGSGTAGMAGMKYVSGKIIRPLLDCSREDIEKYAENSGLDYRTDSTNLKALCDRNKIRLNILPVFRENFGRNVIESTIRTSQLCRQDDDYISSLAFKLYNELRDQNGIPRESVTDAHPAISSRLIRIEYERARGDLKDLSFKHVQIIIRYLESSAGRGTLDLPGGLTAVLFKGRFSITRKGESRS
ncbi:MAG: tRNA lysidine(34) synthetase TilS [Eubacteriales bacterium]|nr:tRNA lysidine(34) synthetase TilS [Eubacteriales bacterium]MDD4326870.1 tRNA lysidine(34) synthetase TilS [Eubacteriales bacterium]MDD4716596.1 tRNA lysidine(34) synthetase TilS [Eubacteriales bacterium]